MKTSRLLFSLALLVVSCGGETTTTTTETTTTTTEATTTTTVMRTTTTWADGLARSAVNGLPVDDPDSVNRRVIAIKVDNHPNARPQSGIENAELVFEIRVEAGLTRFLAVFHQSDSEFVGPVRSGRPSDAKLVVPFEAPFFISGAQSWVLQGIRDLNVSVFVDPRPGMFRVTFRDAPHNLYADTTELRALADNANIPDDAPPTPLWDFGPLPENAEDATTAIAEFSDGITVTWVWNGETYDRWINDVESYTRTEGGEQSRIQADVLVFLVGKYYVVDPPAGSTGSSVPATDSTGSGRLIIMASGKKAEGTWERESPSDPFTLKDADGNILYVPPGRAWVSIVPDVGELTVPCVIGPDQRGCEGPQVH